LAAERVAELILLRAVYRDGQRLERDEPVKPGQHLQIYRNPTRFPADAVDWRSCILAEEADFLVVRKPVGIPVHATVDNWRDNVLFHLRQLTGGELRITHRLDVPVGGLLVLARHSDFQRVFNSLLADRGVRKVYRAIVDKPPPSGRQKHYMEPEEKNPRKVSTEPMPGWEVADLVIGQSRELRFPHTDYVYWDIPIELETGRTHQIRAQLAHVGCPIAGDRLYGSTVRYSRLKLGTGIGLFSAELEWPRPGGGRWHYTAEPPWGKS
jgi:23S rRNA pseudouridine1911/1915/1917 synthase